VYAFQFFEYSKNRVKAIKFFGKGGSELQRMEMGCKAFLQNSGINTGYDLSFVT
jgi:hypothetical protein